MNTPAMPELDPADIVVDVVRKPMGGFAFVNTNGVIVTHKPSGIAVTVDAHKSMHENRQAALDKLRMTLATLQAQPAEVSDATINRLVYEHTKLNPNQADDLDLLLGFRKAVRAILALRPQAVPMTREQRKAVVEAAEVLMKADINLPWRDAIITATEAHHRINAPAGGEG